MGRRPTFPRGLLRQRWLMLQTDFHRTVWFETAATRGKASLQIPDPPAPPPPSQSRAFKFSLDASAPSLIFCCIPGWVGRLPPPLLEGLPSRVLSHAGPPSLPHPGSVARSRPPTPGGQEVPASTFGHLGSPLYCWPLGLAFFLSLSVIVAV